MSRIVTVRWCDLSAVLAWTVVVVLAALDSADGKVGLLGLWAALIAPGAATLSACAFHARRDDYQRGLDQGLQMADIVKLPQHH